MCSKDNFVGYAVTGRGSQEHADYLVVVKYLGMWLIFSPLSAQPSNHTLQPLYPTYWPYSPLSRNYSPLC